MPLRNIKRRLSSWKITIRPILRMPVPPICFQTCTTTSLLLICSGRNCEEAVTELKTAFTVRREYASLGLIENNDTLQQTLSLANMLVQNKEYDSALEVIDFCESTIEEVIGTNNLDYGLCEFYRGVIAYTRSQPVIAEQHLLNADAVFHDVMNENPDNDYSKSTARYLYSLYMRWGRKELAEQYNKILISTH